MLLFSPPHKFEMCQYSPEWPSPNHSILSIVLLSNLTWATGKIKHARTHARARARTHTHTHTHTHKKVTSSRLASLQIFECQDSSYTRLTGVKSLVPKLGNMGKEAATKHYTYFPSKPSKQRHFYLSASARTIGLSQNRQVVWDVELAGRNINPVRILTCEYCPPRTFSQANNPLS